MDLNELKKRTDKEDTILEIESFQKMGNDNFVLTNEIDYNFTERWKTKRHKKENLFNAKNLSCFTKKLKQFREQTI